MLTGRDLFLLYCQRKTQQYDQSRYLELYLVRRQAVGPAKASHGHLQMSGRSWVGHQGSGRMLLGCNGSSLMVDVSNKQR